MRPAEQEFGVWLGMERVGTIHQLGDHTRFTLAEAYLEDPRRPVLGLAFEQDLRAPPAALVLQPAARGADAGMDRRGPWSLRRP